jgi:predicted kinase
MKPYVLKAREHGYTVKLVPVEIKNTAKELAERNVHNVPEAAIQRMLDKYNPNISEEDILNSERPKIAPKRTP